MVTLQRLRTLVEQVRPANPAGVCRETTADLVALLRENRVQFERIDGFFHAERIRGVQTSEHAYVVVPAEQIEDYDDGDEVILDPTIDQFTMEYFDVGASEAYVPRGRLPNRFIIYPDDTVYEAYDTSTA